jgi:hypothetical protein
MIRGLYADNHLQRREQAIQDTDNHCSTCKILLGQVKVSRRRRLWFDYGQLHHPDGDPENPNARVEILCASCHMKAHRRPEKEKAKATPRKTGYEVVRLPALMERLASVGLRTWKTETGRVAWQIGNLEAEAEDSLDALLMAVHWMEAEMRYLADKLEQAPRVSK